MDLSDGKINVERQEKGAWVEEIPEMQGLRVKTRGTQNRDWVRLQKTLWDAVPRKKKIGGRISDDEQDRITGLLLLNTCLLDWDGLLDGGKPLPFDKEFARELVTKPEYRKYRDAFLWAASVVAEQDDVEQKDAAGN